MKAKVILVASLALMLVTAGSALAAPANGQGQGNRNGTCVQQGLCDTNGDGICDGTGAGAGMKYGNGSFVDSDGDGVCDLSGGTHPQDGTGMQHGRNK
ncbi:hypothetical protein [Acetobacterium tundrae]|uniref:Low-complexity protein n=1 Tax=Acetobacterium tundrae TaxID=132932 RepID=A0ABR6WH43_9FIRM|nr:hypothetical protein [Acetobacterium tundrae]MBC3795789.1 hypothetical protein [Acetobacterium tundrae]